MASNHLPPYILTPQQQSLLFAALASNTAPAIVPQDNSALSLSPTALDKTSQPTKPTPVARDASLLDYELDLNPDSSYDFDLSGMGPDVSAADMTADLASDLTPGARSNSAGGSSSNKSDTAAEPEQHEKRSRSDEGGEPESGAKRREGAPEKTPKKPGRKPLTSEPTSKRKAQNRAAQRAFRERKERHLSDLETKVEELQKASDEANNKNVELQARIDAVTAERDEYKKRVSLLFSQRPSIPPKAVSASFQWGSAAVNNLNDVNFHFDFPKFGSLPGPPSAPATNGVHQSHQSSALLSPAESATSPNNTAVASPTSPMNGLGRSASHSTEDFSSLNGLFGPTYTSGTMNNASLTSLDSTGLNFGATAATNSPSMSSNSNMGANSSCGTSPEPFTQSPMGFKPVDQLTTIGEEATALGTTHTPPTLTATNLSAVMAAANGTQQNLAGGAVDMSSLHWLTNQNGGSFDPQLFGDYREPQDSILSQGGLDGASFFDDAFDIDFLTPYNVTPENFSHPQQQKDILGEIDKKKMEDGTTTTTMMMDGQKMNAQLLTCTKIWEKIQNCPRVQNGDFDLDNLCDELKKKAKCTGSGPMVNESDFKDVIKKFVKSECASEALAMAQQGQEKKTLPGMDMGAIGTPGL